jgi:hypothetical protein
MVSLVHLPKPRGARPTIAARSEYSQRMSAVARRRRAHFILTAACLGLPLVAALALRATMFVPQ